MKRTQRSMDARAVALIPLVALLAGACIARPVVANDVTTKTVVSFDLSAQRIDKIDLLFMIDNSASMGDKQDLLREAVPDLLGRLVQPNCVDTKDANAVVGTSHDGTCDAGKLEFQPVDDIHVAVISSSIGDRGSDQSCPRGGVSPGSAQLPWHYDDRAHLLDRVGTDGHPLADASPSGFLAWFPASDANLGKAAPPVPAIGDVARLGRDFGDLVAGVGEYGCFFEAQEEAWYRFLVAPDPELVARVDGDVAVLEGIDEELLAQRRAFLRPDSLVAIIDVTDENESTVDPRSLGGHGYRFESKLGAPRATPACARTPNDPACTSCPDAPGTPGCERPYFGSAEGAGDPADPLNVRFFHMKQRFGVDPQYPIDRYVRALTSPTVPSRAEEHPPGSSAYAPAATCTNPLFAAALPERGTGDVCHLPVGAARRPGMIFFATITGVPSDLLHFDPTRADKSRLDDSDWTKILGKDPLAYDFDGADPRMLESIDARPGRPTTGPDRDWNTAGIDLQYACTFDLKAPKRCDGRDPACDCSDTPASPLCDPADNTLQRRAKAYPGVRHLAIAKALGAQAVVSSICPIDATDNRPANALYGYRPAVKAIVDALKGALAAQCLPQPLPLGPEREAPCLVLEALPASVGSSETLCDRADLGLTIPAPEVVARFREQHPGEARAAVCEVAQLLSEAGASCADDPRAGWCYVHGAAATVTSCSDAILFSPKGDPRGGAHVFLQCIETRSPGDAKESDASR